MSGRCYEFGELKSGDVLVKDGVRLRFDFEKDGELFFSRPVEGGWFPYKRCPSKGFTLASMGCMKEINDND